KQLEDLMIEEGDTIRLQPCFSPVWDTALTLIALADGGVPSEATAVSKGIRWLLDKEVRRSGDWSLSNPRLEPAGWFFEYRNGFYPDTDDTAMVLMALARSGTVGWAESSRPTMQGTSAAWHALSLRRAWHRWKHLTSFGRRPDPQGVPPDESPIERDQ